jgi:4-amino-4-deoxy-L-arabinose transferase-like glycosyltransferase
LLGVLGLAALLRLLQLDQNGYGRQYYAAGVRSMLGSLHNFFFNAFDPAGFVSLDKPPVALWLQVASAKLLGFSAFSVMLPQVLEGLAAVFLIHRLVQRRFGDGAALVAALCLALTPISVAVDRSNNTDSCLIMVLLLAAWVLIRATETASARLLVLAMALVGVGFNVKMAAALVVAPTFVLVYFLGAAGLSLRQRLAHLTLSALMLVFVSLSWVTAFDLTPPTERPYAGSTEHNSMLELALLHNGLKRFTHQAVDTAVNQGARDGSEPDSTADSAPPSDSRGSPQSRSRRPLWDQTQTGVLRLLSPFHAAQMGWWLPFVMVGAFMGALAWRRNQGVTAAQSDLLLWGGWALSYAIIFSFAGGVFHTYYLAVLAPALAALSGIGWAALWRRYRDGSWRYAMPAALLLGAVWQLYIGHDDLQRAFLTDWRSLLLSLSATGLIVSGIGLALGQFRTGGGVGMVLAGLGLFASLLMPGAWALSTVLARPNVAAPAANIAVLAEHKPADSSVALSRQSARERFRKLMGFLKVNRGTERFLVAVPNATQAAPIIVYTGEAVMTVGGYLGRDPILTPGEFERRVQAGEVRFAILGGPSIVPPHSAGERAMADWIRAHGVVVEPGLWGGSRDNRVPAQLFDLRPPQDGTPYQRGVRKN